MRRTAAAVTLTVSNYFSGFFVYGRKSFHLAVWVQLQLRAEKCDLGSGRCSKTLAERARSRRTVLRRAQVLERRKLEAKVSSLALG